MNIYDVTSSRIILKYCGGKNRIADFIISFLKNFCKREVFSQNQTGNSIKEIIWANYKNPLPLFGEDNI